MKTQSIIKLMNFMKKYREGSMGASDQKAELRFMLGETIVFVVLFVVALASHNFKVTQVIWNIVGIAMFLVGLAASWYFYLKQDEEEKSYLKWVLLGAVLPLAGLVIATSGGL